MNDLVSASLAWVRSPDYVELTSRQFALLGLVCDEQGPHHVRRLAQSLKVSKPVITRAATVLEELGFVVRRRLTSDRRDKVLEATSAGREFRDMLALLAGDQANG